MIVFAEPYRVDGDPVQHGLKNRTTDDAPPAIEDPPEDGDGGGGTHLVIACRGYDDPREQCSYCDDLGTYQTRNGADPEFEPVCAQHAGEFLSAMGAVLRRLPPLPPQ